MSDEINCPVCGNVMTIVTPKPSTNDPLAVKERVQCSNGHSFPYGGDITPKEYED